MSRIAFVSALCLTSALACGDLAAAQTPPASVATSPGKPPHKAHRRADSTAMQTSAVTPTGPDTTTAGAGATSDLSGSTGATVDTPAAIAPPSPAPPGGAPSGGVAPNEDGGPH